MKNKEKKLIRFINDNTNRDFVATENNFSHYDCYDDDYIVELKIRKEYYKDKLMEAYKGLNLITLAELDDKMALYVVGDSKGVYFFNLTHIQDYFLENPVVRIPMPKSTEFGESKKVNKFCYTLDESLAFKTIPL